MLAPWKKRYYKPRQHIKKQRYYFADRGLYSQSFGFSSSPCTDMRVGLKIRLSTEEFMLLNCGAGGQIKPVNPKRDQWA